MIRDRDIEKLVDVFAAKEDLKQVASSPAKGEDIHELQKLMNSCPK